MAFFREVVLTSLRKASPDGADPSRFGWHEIKSNGLLE